MDATRRIILRMEEEITNGRFSIAGLASDIEKKLIIGGFVLDENRQIRIHFLLGTTSLKLTKTGRIRRRRYNLDRLASKMVRVAAKALRVHKWWITSITVELIHSSPPFTQMEIDNERRFR